MYPSTNTRSGRSASIETLAIHPYMPSNYTNSTCLTNFDLENICTPIKSITNSTTDILAKLDDTSFKIYKQEEKLTYILSKLSTYEYHIDKANINEMQHPFPL